MSGNQDYVLDEINKLKLDPESDNKRMMELQQARNHLSALEKAEIKLLELQEVINRIRQCTTEEKRLALDALDINVKATRDNIEITGVIPIDKALTHNASKR